MGNSKMSTKIINIVFTLFLMLSFLNCGKLKCGPSKFDQEAKGIISNINNFQQYFKEMLSSKNLTKEKTKAIFEKAQKKLQELTDSAKDSWKSFDDVLQKANKKTKEHMNEVHQKITEKIEGVEKAVRALTNQIKEAKKEEKEDKKKKKNPKKKKKKKKKKKS